MPEDHTQRAFAPLVLVCVLACGGDKAVSGHVLDYNTGAPIAGVDVRVSQSGWGLSNGGLVWDKSYVTSGRSDGSGAFTVHYSVGSSAKVTASHAEFSEFQHSYEANSVITIKLKRLAADYVPLPTRYASVGVQTDGRFIGWDFASASAVTNADSADIIATFVDPDTRGTIRVSAHGRGGLAFVPQQALGVDDDFLVFADSAPETGYVRDATLDFGSAGGLLFVRTRDGEHYAKLEFTPSGFASSGSSTVRRSLDLRSVYNPVSSRSLRYQHAPLPRAR